MGLTRRALIRRSSLLLGGLGAVEAGLTLLTDRYAQVLAAPARRRLALLVGINQYPEAVCDFAPPKGGTALNGCITDVELQRELLIHRFGASPADILTLTDQAATRSSIESAFQAHLIDQARPGDVVIFHFSGLGSQVRLNDGSNASVDRRSDARLTSLVPIDGLLPTEADPAIRDVMVETLELLLRSLPTQQVLTVLDCSSVGSGNWLSGALRVRSRPNAPTGKLLQAERLLQERLQAQLSGRQRSPANLPGVLITAAAAEQPALEGQWGSFSAGLLTYALTQRLWEMLPARTIQFVVQRASRDVAQIARDRQQPTLTTNLAATATVASLLGQSEQLTSSDGAIAASITASNQTQLWLGGLPAAIVDSLSPGSLFVVAGLEGKAPASMVDLPLLQVRSREGLRASAVPVGTVSEAMPLQEGQLLQEWVRVIPRHVGLTIALDSQLERIERVDATSAFAAAKVAVVTAGEQSADYVFGKQGETLPAVATAIAPETSPVPSADISPRKDVAPPKQRYGLYLPGRSVISDTLGEPGEAVKTAVNRLTPYVRSLQARKLLRLTENAATSRLGVLAELLQVNAAKPQPLWQQATLRAPYPALAAVQLSSDQTAPAETGVKISAGTVLHVQLSNYSDQPVNFLALGCDRRGRFVLLLPDASLPVDAGNYPMVLPAGEHTLLPLWRPNDALGQIETYLLCSRKPFTQTLIALTSNRSSLVLTHASPLKHPLEVVQAVLQDLNSGSPAGFDIGDACALDVNQWATLSCSYQVV